MDMRKTPVGDYLFTHTPEQGEPADFVHCSAFEVDCIIEDDTFHISVLLVNGFALLWRYARYKGKKEFKNRVGDGP